MKRLMFGLFLAIFCKLAAAQQLIPEAIEARESAGRIASHQAAVVAVDGKLVRGYHAVHAKRLWVGTYEVVFDRPVDKSVYSATLATPDVSGAPSGSISMSPRQANPRAVYVITRDTRGLLADRAFHLLLLSF